MLASLALAVPAHGATVSVDASRLVVAAQPGERNDVAVSDVPDRGYFSVRGARPGTGCTDDDTGTRCSKEGVDAVLVDLGDGRDVATTAVSVPATIRGGDGHDVLTAPHSGLADGGRGDDAFPLARGVRGALRGGPGSDRLLVGVTDPSGSARPGWTIDFGAGGATDPDGALVTSSFTEMEDAYGSAGADVLEGGDEPNLLDGHTGPDRLAGRGGNDSLSGIDATIRLDHRGRPEYERWSDDISCGGGRDTASVDLADDWTRDCERVLVHEVSSSGPRRLRVELNGDATSQRIAVTDDLPGLVLGRGGDDRLAGGPRRDRIYAGGGDDRVDAAGGGRDAIGCGAGTDIVHADRRDSVRGDCERVERR
jgi:Ca2+-binding RTX toxin-like protein